MARKAMIEKEKRRIAKASRSFEKRQRLKAVIKDLNTTVEEREQAMRALNKMPKNTSAIRVRNRCQFTGRSRGYFRKFGMSRLCFRQMANDGRIPGVMKASW